MSESRHELLRGMNELCSKTVECLTLLQKAFVTDSTESLHAFRTLLAECKGSESGLSKKISHQARSDQAIHDLVAVPGHFEKIFGFIGQLADILQTKITQNILVSDRAVTEFIFLSQRLMEILRATGDLILVENPILLRYILESHEYVGKVTTEYATLHEERLIEGLCLPMAAPHYLKILDLFKGISREAMEIAKNFSR